MLICYSPASLLPFARPPPALLSMNVRNLMVHVPGEDDDDVYVHNFVTEGELDFHLE